MKIAVRYYSRAGSTKKLAEALAQGIGVKAASTATPLAEPVDLLFIGGAPYITSQLAPQLRQFLHQLTVDQVKHIAVFSTSNWKMAIRKQAQRSLADPKIDLLEDSFQSRGSLGAINKSHPTAEECDQVVAFAKRVIAQVQE